MDFVYHKDLARHQDWANGGDLAAVVIWQQRRSGKVEICPVDGNWVGSGLATVGIWQQQEFGDGRNVFDGWDWVGYNVLAKGRAWLGSFNLEKDSSSKLTFSIGLYKST